MSEKELQMKTRREIVALGTQLGKLNIAAWAGKEDEGKDILTSLKTEAVTPPAKSAVETRAVAWEEAEKAKYMARLIHLKPSVVLFPKCFFFCTRLQLHH